MRTSSGKSKAKAQMTSPRTTSSPRTIRMRLRSQVRSTMMRTGPLQTMARAIPMMMSLHRNRPLPRMIRAIGGTADGHRHSKRRSGVTSQDRGFRQPNAGVAFPDIGASYGLRILRDRQRRERALQHAHCIGLRHTGRPNAALLQRSSG